MVRMCGPNSPFFSVAWYTISPPPHLSRKLYMTDPFFLDWYMNGPIFLHPCFNVHIFAQIFSSEIQTETKFYYLCVNFDYRWQTGHALLYKMKGQHMNMSTLCTIKYMNRSYFSNGVGFKILAHPYQNTPSFHRGSLKLWLYIVKLGV